MVVHPMVGVQASMDQAPSIILSLTFNDLSPLWLWDGKYLHSLGQNVNICPKQKGRWQWQEVPSLLVFFCNRRKRFPRNSKQTSSYVFDRTWSLVQAYIERKLTHHDWAWATCNYGQCCYADRTGGLWARERSNWQLCPFGFQLFYKG